MMRRKCSLSAIFLLCLALISLAINAVEVSYDERAITIDGKRKILFSGSIHYPRSTPEMWPYLIRKAKEGGLDVIETYVFWNAHEPQRRQYDFSGNLDLVRFIQTIQNEGLYAMLRIGPYIRGEWNYGGLPVWLHNIPNMKFRTNNPAFMDEMKTFTTLIVDTLKNEKLFASQGGPIIVAQIENEYGNVMHAYGDSGKEYVKWCAQLADSYQIGVPWVMCQQSDAPHSMINTCNGYYCDQFQPNNNNKPKIWTENWTGWYKNWGMQNPRRTAEDVAYAVASTMAVPILDELLEGHISLLLMTMTLLWMNMATVYTYFGKSVCFIGNAHQSRDATINFRNNEYTIPAWSVSILPNCSSEAYNTAKVNTQTSIMVKKDNGADEEEEYTLNWQWRQEPFMQMKNDQIIGTIDLTSSQLLDQKVVTNDASDYLWYITSFDIKENDPLWSKDFRIRVHTRGHVLHVFVNGKHVGTQHAKNGHFKFVYESKIKLVTGKNEISLLSTTVGLPNYGAFFENVEVGVLGPVELVAEGNDYDYDGDEIVQDLSKNKWNYKVGLHGEHEMHYSYQNSLRVWYTDGIPTHRIFVWYKTTFKSPIGDDPVVVDLSGLGKGHAWVNGNSIGRYWPSYLADEDGCSQKCDYRGTYSSNKCLSKCGKPSQRWYHVPRSFLRDDDQNTLVLFEELGGHPFDVKFRTVTVGKICANAYEGHALELECRENQVISEIRFASFGLPNGECGSFQKGRCESREALSVIKAQCLGKDRCSIQVSERTLGPTGCRVAQNRFAVEALCDIKVNEEVRKQ
ncbi:Beta-galactosidase protein [Spatholobus suberectus]|nr:Beta-galactosidase protein [Spatholobus suberectus]